MANQRKVSSILINPDFQGKFLALFTIFGLFQAFVNYYAIYFSFGQIKTLIKDNVPERNVAILDMVDHQQVYLVSFIGFAFAISFVLFVVIGLRFTHQAAGALRRFKLEFTDMKEKKSLHPISLRKGDFFRDVEQAFNEMVREIDSSSQGPDA